MGTEGVSGRLRGALSLTLAVFAALLALHAGYSAYGIWGLGHVDPKFGNPWSSLRFSANLGILFLGTQCGFLLVGNVISAALLGSAWNRVAVIASCGFVVADVVGVASGLGVVWPLLCGLPAVFVLLVALASLLESDRRSQRRPVSTPAKG